MVTVGGDPPSRRVAVLGTGIMGGPMARHLRRAGLEVTAWDRDPTRTQALTSAGVRAATTAGEAVEQADTVITMLTDAETVIEVMEQVPGFSGLWLQTTTVGIDGSTRLGILAAERGATFVDVPLLGTRSSVETAGLTALASGPAHAEGPSRDILETFARNVIWLGDAGRGSRLKLVMNGWVLGLTTLTAETVGLAAGLGFDPTVFLDLIAGGPLDVAQAHIKAAAMATKDFTPALPLRLAAKDAGLIVAAGEISGVELKVARAVAAQLEAALAAGHGDEDVAAVIYAVNPEESR